mmetsp:Transcript_109187/g.282255  ORF Transcript_109187/g.282255 Transcript_109187/m.282255 type:complete len:94 (-) Transcript_109187:207-488(-)
MAHLSTRPAMKAVHQPVCVNWYSAAMDSAMSSSTTQTAELAKGTLNKQQLPRWTSSSGFTGRSSMAPPATPGTPASGSLGALDLRGRNFWMAL